MNCMAVKCGGNRTMAVDVRVNKLIKHVQDLLCCDGISLFLGCSDPALSHPLLRQRSYEGLDASFVCATTLGYMLSSYDDEHIKALCDLAVQSGGMWSFERIPLEKQGTGSVAVWPLENSEGILGLLLCVCFQPEAFLQGECALLAQYLPTFIERLEAIMHQASSLDDLLDKDSIVQLRSQAELVSVVSHELRVPLSAIKGYVGLLQVYGQPEDGLEAMPLELKRRYLDAIMEQAKHMEMLVGDLLDISRVQEGRLVLHPRLVDVGQLCLQVVTQVQQRVEQQQPGRYQIHCYIKEQLPICRIDAGRVRQILTNLLENAIKYSPDGGSIEVQVSTCPVQPEDIELQSRQFIPQFPSSGRLIYIIVRDQGIGIPNHQQASLFQPFTRLSHPLARNVSGNGLGLYISRKLAEAMGGEVVLTSHEGRGTCVTFMLPTMETNEAPIPREIMHSLL
jgi:signal transduction histidine kinase